MSAISIIIIISVTVIVSILLVVFAFYQNKSEKREDLSTIVPDYLTHRGYGERPETSIQSFESLLDYDEQPYLYHDEDEALLLQLEEKDEPIMAHTTAGINLAENEYEEKEPVLDYDLEVLDVIKDVLNIMINTPKIDLSIIKETLLHTDEERFKNISMHEIRTYLIPLLYPDGTKIEYEGNFLLNPYYR